MQVWRWTYSLDGGGEAHEGSNNSVDDLHVEGVQGSR